MRVTQTISIGTLRINSMSNSSIVQVGASGSMKSRAKDIKEYIPQAEADQKLEKQVAGSIKPIFDKEGLPIDPAGTTAAGNGTATQQPGSQQTGRQQKSRKKRS